MSKTSFNDGNDGNTIFRKEEVDNTKVADGTQKVVNIKEVGNKRGEIMSNFDGCPAKDHPGRTLEKYPKLQSAYRVKFNFVNIAL